MIRILIADDHAIVRTGLAALLEAGGFDVVGEAEDGERAIRQAAKLHPDIVILDLMMPVLDGTSAIASIKTRSPKSKILILTTAATTNEFARALQAGADGILTKSTPNAKLLEGIAEIVAGKTVISPEIREMLRSDPPTPKLTERQLQVLAYITKGLTNADISRLLKISPTSVRDHLDALFLKLGAANRTEAVAIALRKQLLKT